MTNSSVSTLLFFQECIFSNSFVMILVIVVVMIMIMIMINSNIIYCSLKITLSFSSFKGRQ